jgi:hypothetical protein
MSAPPAPLRRLKDNVAQLWKEYCQRTGRFYSSEDSTLRENHLATHTIGCVCVFAQRSFEARVHSVLKAAGGTGLNLESIADSVVQEALNLFRNPDLVPSDLYRIITQPRFSVPDSLHRPSGQRYSLGLTGYIENSLDQKLPELEFLLSPAQAQKRRVRRKTLTAEQVQMGVYRHKILDPAWTNHKHKTGKGKAETLREFGIPSSSDFEFENGIVSQPQHPDRWWKLCEELGIDPRRLLPDQNPEGIQMDSVVTPHRLRRRS